MIDSVIGLSKDRARFVRRHNLIGLGEIVKAVCCDVERWGATKRDKSSFSDVCSRSVKSLRGDTGNW